MKQRESRNGKPRHWWHDEVAYEIYVQSFKDTNGDGIGDLNGITEALDYLQELGVGCLWLTPIMESPFADCGYDISDHYRINPAFGTMADFRRLLDEAHARGLKVIIDLVPGYTSDQHAWFKAARMSKDAPTRENYVWGVGKDGGPPNNWYSPPATCPAWTYNEATGDYYYHAFLPSQPHLNWNSHKLQKEMYKFFEFWLDTGIDGFRVDAVNYIIADEERRDNPGEGFDQIHVHDRNHRNVHLMLKSLRQLADRYRDQMLVGEIFPGHPEESKLYHGNGEDELHLTFNLAISQIAKKGRWYDGEYAAEAKEKRDDPAEFVPELRRAVREYDEVFRAAGLWPTVVLGNHDQPRVYSVYGRLVPLALRDRMAKVIAAYTLLAKGTPFLYYGEEIGMENTVFEKVEELKDTFGVCFYHHLRGEGLPHAKAMEYAQNITRDVCRTPMQWDGSSNAGFSANSRTWLKVNPNYLSKNVAAQRGDPDSILNFYKALIGLRRKFPALCGGEYVWLDGDSKQCLAFMRRTEDEAILVALNFSAETCVLEPLTKADGASTGEIELLLSNCARGERSYQGRIALEPAEAFVGLVRQSGAQCR